MAITITWLSPKTCQAVFSGTIPTQAQLSQTTNFSVEAESGVSVTIYKSIPTSGVGTTVLSVGPSVLPEQTYIVKFANEVAITTVPANITPVVSSEWSHKMLDALTECFGEAVQRFSGKPQTLVVSNFKNSDTAIFVETTIGFPNKGRLFIDGKTYTYTSKDAMSFKGVSGLNFYNTGLSPQTLVTCDVNAIFPS